MSELVQELSGWGSESIKACRDAGLFCFYCSLVCLIFGIQNYICMRVIGFQALFFPRKTLSHHDLEALAGIMPGLLPEAGN